MPVQAEVVGSTWGTLAFPQSLSHRNCSFFCLLSSMEQIQPAGSLDLSYTFPEQEENHGTMKQLECMCLPVPTNPCRQKKSYPSLCSCIWCPWQHFSVIISGYRHCFCVTHNWTHQMGSHSLLLLRSSSQSGQVLPSVLGQWRRRHFKSRLGFGAFVSCLKKRLFKIIQCVIKQRLTRWPQPQEKHCFKM